MDRNTMQRIGDDAQAHGIVHMGDDEYANGQVDVPTQDWLDGMDTRERMWGVAWFSAVGLTLVALACAPNWPLIAVCLGCLAVIAWIGMFTSARAVDQYVTQAPEDLEGAAAEAALRALAEGGR